MHRYREYRDTGNAEILGMQGYRVCRNTGNAEILVMLGYLECMDTENTGILGIQGFSRSAKIHGMQRYREYRIQEVQRYWKCRDPGNARNAESAGMLAMQRQRECRDTGNSGIKGIL